MDFQDTSKLVLPAFSKKHPSSGDSRSSLVSVETQKGQQDGWEGVEDTLLLAWPEGTISKKKKKASSPVYNLILSELYRKIKLYSVLDQGRLC